MAAPNISFGGGGIGFFPRELLDGMVETLEKHNVKEIDTAFIYVRLSLPFLYTPHIPEH